MFVLGPQYHPTLPLFLKIYLTQKKYYLSPNRMSCHIIPFLLLTFLIPFLLLTFLIPFLLLTFFLIL